jgi:hypothetical protein
VKASLKSVPDPETFIVKVEVVRSPDANAGIPVIFPEGVNV